MTKKGKSNRKRKTHKKASFPASNKTPRTNLSRSLRATIESRLFRFLIVGGINTGFSYSVYASLLYLGVTYKLANLGALILGILVSFKTQGKFVFRNTENRLFFRFLVSWTVIYLFNILLIGGLMRLGLDAYVSGAIALLPVTLLSYFMQKIFVFGKFPVPGGARA